MGAPKWKTGLLCGKLLSSTFFSTFQAPIIHICGEAIVFVSLFLSLIMLSFETNQGKNALFYCNFQQIPSILPYLLRIFEEKE